MSALSVPLGEERTHYEVYGSDMASDASLLAAAIGTGAGGLSPMFIALGLLEHFGGLVAVSHASAAALAQVRGVGAARATRLHAAFALARRAEHRAADLAPSIVRSPQAAWRHFAPLLADCPCEELHAIYLGSRGRVLVHRCLTRGSDRHTVVDPRQVFRPGIELGAVSVIVAHNHPSGDKAPSQPDRDVTRRLANAGRLLGIALLDHLVVTRTGYTSLAEAGELAPWAEELPAWTG